MATSASRIGGGFLALAAIWIGVYWFWEPSRSAGVSFAPDPEAEPLVTLAEPSPEQPTTPSAQPEHDPAPDDPAVSPPPPAVEPPEFREYVVRANDTFSSISSQFFGTTRHADAIAKANPFVSPTSLSEGRTIRVPADPENVQGIPADPETPVIEEPQPIEYVVVKGDTLSEIAQRFYGSMRHAPIIFNANRDTMTSMDDLSLGQVLRIPPRESVLENDGG